MTRALLVCLVALLSLGGCCGSDYLRTVQVKAETAPTAEVKPVLTEAPLVAVTVSPDRLAR